MVRVTSRSKRLRTRTPRHGLASVPKRPRLSLILDTSGVVALLNTEDNAHDACVRVASQDLELIVPPLTLGEIDYWCRKHGASLAFDQFVGDIRRGAYELASLRSDDVQRALDLDNTYGNLNLGIVDASVVALAERLRVTQVLTLDRRGFSVVRPLHCAALTLLPD